MNKFSIGLVACVAAWIGLGGLPFHATAVAQSTKPPEDTAPAPSAPPDIMLVEGRLTIQAPKAPLRLGEDNPIQITLRGPSVQQIFAEESQNDGHGNDVIVEGSEQMLSLQQGAGGVASVHLTPVVLGPVTFSLIVDFADGGVERESFKAAVTAPHPPEKLIAGFPGSNDSRIVMDLSWQWRKRPIFVQAVWPGVAKPLNIPAKDLQFSLIFDKGRPAIRFDPATGEINALRLGDALIEAHYRGLTQPICVQVRETVDFGGFPQCKELLPGGNRVLPTPDYGDAPGARSKLPYTAHDGRKGRFIADDRVEVVPMTHPLNVAEENPIELKVHGPVAVARIDCDTDAGCVPRNGYDKPPPPFTFAQTSPGSLVMQVFPSKLGPTNVAFLILFADGGVALKKISADVGLGTKKPRSIGTSCGNDSYPNPDLPVRLEEGSSADYLGINACYDGVAAFVLLPPQVVKSRVLSEEADPPIRIDDKTGQVTVRRAGHTLLEQEFDGLTRFTCVVVVPNEQFNDPDVSNCRDLRAKYGAALPPLPPLPKPPKIYGPSAESGRQSILREQAITRATLSPDVKDAFNADERLQVVTEGVAAVPGQTASLPLRLQGRDVLAANLTQTVTKYSGAGHSPATYNDQEWDPLTFDAEGTPVIKVLPLRVGKAEFRLRALFADGGVAIQHFELPVRPPADQIPQLFNASRDDYLGNPVIPVTTLHLLVKAPDNVRTLFPYAAWGEKGFPIALDPRDVAFLVKSASGDPVIRLDSETGTVTGLHLGHAVVTMRYAGAESDTCVVVMNDLTAGDSSNCEDMRSH